MNKDTYKSPIHCFYVTISPISAGLGISKTARWQTNTFNTDTLSYRTSLNSAKNLKLNNSIENDWNVLLTKKCPEDEPDRSTHDKLDGSSHPVMCHLLPVLESNHIQINTL